jgi:aryl-alcohol dehydrogenase-like predicted oxidoreductase
MGTTSWIALYYVLSQSVVTAVPGARNVDEMREALRYLHASVEKKQFTLLHEELKYRLRGHHRQEAPRSRGF